MKFYLILVGTIFFSFFSLAQERDDFKMIEFGFNIHYLNEAEKNVKALEQVRQDSFTKIRAFEPFTDSLSVNVSAFVKKVKFIQNFDFHLLLSLSNFIWSPDIDPSRFHVSESNRKFINEAVKYTNRFPPDNEAAYKSFLKTALDSLQNKDCLKSMSFEIGNEPDANRYFWGNAQEWENTVALTADVLKPYTKSVSCCGFSSDLIFLKASDRTRFLEYVNSTGFPDNIKFSYHLYLETYLGKAETTNPQTTKVKGGIITEFGPASSLNADKIELMNSSNVMHYLIQLLEFAYSNDVSTVYLFPLMDGEKHNNQMGYFDSKGNKKSAYTYLLKLREVIKNGYTVFKTADYIEISGKESILRLAERTHNIKNVSVSFCTYKDLKQNKINKGEWLIYRK